MSENKEPTPSVPLFHEMNEVLSKDIEALREQQVMFKEEPNKPPLKPQPRLTVTSSISYEPGDEEAIGTTTGYSRELVDDEQPYERNLKVGPDWLLLSKGCWVQNPCLLVLTNTEGLHDVTNVSPELVRERAEKYLLLGIIPPEPTETQRRDMHSPDRKPADILPVVFSRIDPGETTAIHPENFDRVAVRSNKDVVKLKLLVVPS